MSHVAFQALFNTRLSAYPTNDNAPTDAVVVNGDTPNTTVSLDQWLLADYIQCRAEAPTSLSFFQKGKKKCRYQH